MTRRPRRASAQPRFSKDLLFDLDDFVGRAAPEALEAEAARTYVLKLLESAAKFGRTLS